VWLISFLKGSWLSRSNWEQEQDGMARDRKVMELRIALAARFHGRIQEGDVGEGYKDGGGANGEEEVAKGKQPRSHLEL